MTMEKKEAIKILKDFHDKSALFSVRTALETLYPELAKGEDERVRNQIINFIEEYGNPIHCEWQKDWIAWLEKQGEQKPQRMISAEAKEAMYNKPADTVEPKCEESKTKIFDAPTPFEDKLYVFVAACEFLTLPAKIEFIKEHSQELLDAAKEQIEKEETEWTKEDEHTLQGVIDEIQANKNQAPDYDLATYDRFLSWLKSLKTRYTWKPSDEQMEAIQTAIGIVGELTPTSMLLKELREQLKKLKS